MLFLLVNIRNFIWLNFFEKEKNDRIVQTGVFRVILGQKAFRSATLPKRLPQKPDIFETALYLHAQFCVLQCRCKGRMHTPKPILKGTKMRFKVIEELELGYPVKALYTVVLGLSGAERDVYAFIRSFCDKTGERCYFGNYEFMSQITGYSHTAIGRAMRSLIKRNYIIRGVIVGKVRDVITYRANVELEDKLVKEHLRRERKMIAVERGLDRSEFNAAIGELNAERTNGGNGGSGGNGGCAGTLLWVVAILSLLWIIGILFG